MKWGEWAAALLASLGLVVVLQVATGCYSAEFGHDAASHYITGLLIHDYIAAGFSSPLPFLRDYHAHYPLVGIGHWPPGYYLLEAIWMALFGAGRSAILALSAVITAGMAVLLYGAVAQRFGRIAGAVAAAVLIASPVTQFASAELMLDTPVALLALAASLFYVRYLESGRWVFGLLFGVAASCAILTKGNGVALALLPPLAILFARRFDLLRTVGFWAPVAVVIVMTGPWFAFTYGKVEPGWLYDWGWAYTSTALYVNGRYLFEAFGPVILAAGGVGLIFSWRGRDPFAACMAALFLAVFVFQALVPVALQDRYMIPAFAGLIALAMIAASRLRQGRLIAIGLAVVSFLPLAARVPDIPTEGFADAAATVWKNRVPDSPSVLVVTNGKAEGQVIAEIAMQDRTRPSMFVVRGSRIFGGGGYVDADYESKYHTPAEVMAAIDEYAIPLVILRMEGMGTWSHIGLVEEARQAFPDRWTLIRMIPNRNGEIAVYRIAGNVKGDPRKLIDLSAPRGLTN